MYVANSLISGSSNFTSKINLGLFVGAYPTVVAFVIYFEYPTESAFAICAVPVFSHWKNSTNGLLENQNFWIIVFDFL